MNELPDNESCSVLAWVTSGESKLSTVEVFTQKTATWKD